MQIYCKRWQRTVRLCVCVFVFHALQLPQALVETCMCVFVCLKRFRTFPLRISFFCRFFTLLSSDFAYAFASANYCITFNALACCPVGTPAVKVRDVFLYFAILCKKNFPAFCVSSFYIQFACFLCCC